MLSCGSQKPKKAVRSEAEAEAETEGGRKKNLKTTIYECSCLLLLSGKELFERLMKLYLHMDLGSYFSRVMNEIDKQIPCHDCSILIKKSEEKVLWHKF